MKSKKAAAERDVLYYAGLAVLALIIMIVGFMILTGKATGAIEFLNNLLKFRS